MVRKASFGRQRGKGCEVPEWRSAVRNMARIEKIVAKLPEAERVDVAEWGDHPTFRVRGKNFIFCDAAGRDLSVKLTKEEAEAVEPPIPPSTRPATASAATAGSPSTSPRAPAPSAGGRDRGVDPHLLHVGGAQAPGPPGGGGGELTRFAGHSRRVVVRHGEQQRETA
jgi:hypothetical protein